MAAFVLHLGNQNGFAFQAGGAADPVAFGQHADDFAVRVLADLAHQGFAVGLWHPFAGLDAAIGVDAGVKSRLQGGVLCVQALGTAFRPADLTSSDVSGTLNDWVYMNPLLCDKNAPEQSINN